MINQLSLYQLYRQNTGKSIYRVPASQEGPDQAWQPSRVQEYVFQIVSGVS